MDDVSEEQVIALTDASALSRPASRSARGVPWARRRSEERTSVWKSTGLWIDERTGLASASARVLRWPVPKYVERNLLYALGGLSLISLIFQMLTGFFLTFYYDPDIQNAYNSVDYITYQAPLGWLVRGIHHYNASAILVLIFLHMLRTFFYTTYKKPREITWLSGVLLLMIALGFAFTGHLLPWDQKGYWSTMVGTEIAGKAPLLGDTVARLLRGGPALGQMALTRFYVIHTVLLPVTLLALTALHLHQHRYHGVAPGLAKREQARSGQSVPYYPNWVVMDAILGLGLLGLLVYLSWSTRAPLAFPADPSSTDYLPRPAWYFLFLFQLLHYVPGSLEPFLILIVPALVIGSMILLPFLDRGEERRPWRKPLISLIALLYVAVIVVCTLLAL